MSSTEVAHSVPRRRAFGSRILTVGLIIFALVPWLLLVRVFYGRYADHTGIATPVGFETTKVAFPLGLSKDGRYLVDASGAPFLIQGEAAWSLIAQLTREDAEIYLEDRRRRGVNLIMVNLVEHWFSDHPPQNAYGDSPFGIPGDFSTPADKYFEYARELVRMALAKGIVVLLCPAYLGGDGGSEGWYQEIRRNGPDKLRAYGRYVGERFREFENVIWLDGGDFTPPAADLNLVTAVAQGLRTAAPAQLHAAHWSPETSALDVKANFTFDLNTTYTYHPAYLKSFADDVHGQGRAHFLVESKYEYDDLNSTQRSLRSQAYYALLTGATGQVFGNRWLWTFTRPSLHNRLLGRNWRTALDSPMSRSMGHLKALFANLPWWKLVPDEFYDIQISGQGSKGTMEHPVLASTGDRRLAIAYVPTLEGVKLDLQKLIGPVRVRWYDPTTGRFVDGLGSPLPAAGERQLVPPGKNAAGDTDWILLLETTAS